MIGKIIKFKPIGDEKGYLVALEQNKNIPFEIKRIYYLNQLKKEYPRGFHAHKNLRQVAICINGSCRFVLDDGKERQDYILDSADKGLLIESMTWREMHDFSEGCVVLVLASEYYDEADYIRNYDEFLKEVK